MRVARRQFYFVGSVEHFVTVIGCFLVDHCAQLIEFAAHIGPVLVELGFFSLGFGIALLELLGKLGMCYFHPRG